MLEDLPDEAGTLLARTRELLLASTESHITLAQRARVPYFWLKSMVRGDAADPGVNRVQRLYEALSGKTLL